MTAPKSPILKLLGRREYSKIEFSLLHLRQVANEAQFGLRGIIITAIGRLKFPLELVGLKELVEAFTFGTRKMV